MKLVNVEDLKVLVAVESKGEIRYGMLVTDLFDDISTVEAIPISFIKGLIEELEPAKAAEVDLDKNILEIHSDVVIIQVLKMLIEQWDKENEQKTSD